MSSDVEPSQVITWIVAFMVTGVIIGILLSWLSDRIWIWNRIIEKQ